MARAPDPRLRGPANQDQTKYQRLQISPDRARRPDTKAAPTCGNRTQRDAVRRNRAAWHAEGRPMFGFDFRGRPRRRHSPAPPAHARAGAVRRPGKPFSQRRPARTFLDASMQLSPPQHGWGRASPGRNAVRAGRRTTHPAWRGVTFRARECAYWESVARVGIQAADALRPRAFTGRRAPRRQAVEPAARCRWRCVGHRFRPGQGGDRPRRPHPQR